MRKILYIFLLLITAAIHAQSPHRINYQGIARDASGLPISSGTVGLMFQIFDVNSSSIPVYSETQSSPIAPSGVFVAAIGAGVKTNTSIPFSAISWTAGPYNLKVLADPQNGTNYTIIGNQQLLSVPFALYAEKVPLNLTGAGVTTVTGTFPNFVINTPSNAAQSPTIIGTTPISVTPVPAFGTPTAYIISSSAVSSTNTGVSITGSGNVSVTPNGISSNTFFISAPHPNINYNPAQGSLTYNTISGTNTVIITQSLTLNGSTLTAGPITNSVNLGSFTGPWVLNTSTVTLANNANNVAIGLGNTSSKLTVYDNVGVNATIFGSNGYNSSGLPTSHGIYGRTINSHSLASGVLGEATGGPGLYGLSNLGPSVFALKTTGFNNMGRFLRAGNVVGSNHGVLIVDSTSANALFAINRYNDTGSVAGFFDGGLIVKAKNNIFYDRALRVVDKNANDFFVVRNDGNTGIGTPQPVEHFQIEKSGLVSLSMISTNNNGAAVSFGNPGNHFIGNIKYDLAGNSMSFWTNNTADRLFIDNAGNVGIKNNSPGPYDLNIFNPSNNTSIRLRNALSGNLGLVISQSNTAANILSYENTPLYFGTNTTTKMTILQNGNVGIGTMAPSVNSRLAIADGHLQSKQNIAPGIIGNNGNSAAFWTVAATDMGGIVQITTPASPAAGAQATITFNKPYANMPIVIITPVANQFGAQAISANQVYVTSSPTGFIINFVTPFTPLTSMYFNYIVIETN